MGSAERVLAVIDEADAHDTGHGHWVYVGSILRALKPQPGDTEDSSALIERVKKAIENTSVPSSIGRFVSSRWIRAALKG